MQRYVQQLLADIKIATENVSWPFHSEPLQLHDWIPDEVEEQIAPLKELEEWTGIRQEMLPPVSMLDDTQVLLLLTALKKMLDTYNCCFVLQTEVPEKIQYATIRQNFSQVVKVKRWHMGFFELCRPSTAFGKCALGQYCQCEFFAELFKDMVDEELDVEEERARALAIEIRYIKKKYGDRWMKYYPYHLDKNYDDENGNPYNYGLDRKGEEDEDDNWWRK